MTTATLAGRMLNYTLPLDPDDTRRANMSLPADLTRDEAERIAAFVAALVMS